MPLSIIYSASYCFTVFAYKLHSDQFSSCLFPRQISVKIPVILRTLDFFYKNLGFCLELGLLNSETEIGTGVA